MRTKLTFIFIALFIFSFNANSSLRWNATGHRTVGKIAESYLKSSTKRKIKKLLDGKSLAFVSTYADEIKSDKRYNEFYTWHYINMSLDSNYEDSEKNLKGELVTGISYCKKIINAENSSIEDKAFYLKLLIHFIGDLHQPMHIGKVEDRGGNDVKLQWFFKNTNLHRVWDSEMINSFGMSYIELAENTDRLTKEQVKAIQEGTVIDWVNETHILSNKVYASVTEGENLRYRYSYDYFETVRSQLQIAGIRLAKVLNELF
jgi:nuclease S1